MARIGQILLPGFGTLNLYLYNCRDAVAAKAELDGQYRVGALCAFGVRFAFGAFSWL